MTFENFNSENFNLPSALAEVRGIMDEVLRTGANDFERSEFERIISELESGAMEPERAVFRAREILDSKQSYH